MGKTVSKMKLNKTKNGSNKQILVRKSKVTSISKTCTSNNSNTTSSPQNDSSDDYASTDNTKSSDSTENTMKQTNTENILSLSDEEDEDNETDTFTWLTTTQQTQLNEDGYCMIQDPTKTKEIIYVIQGFIRESYDGKGIIIKELITQITYYYGSKYNHNLYIELISGGQMPEYFLVPKINVKLSNLIGGNIEIGSSTIEVKQVPPETLHHVLRYLGHHKGIEPDAVPCPVRSIHMNQIVTDQWDATFMDAFEKKTVFEIILAANYMDIKCLLHLGCAKIATLIKALDQNEINRIIEEEERYRREENERKDREEEDDDDSDGDKNENENKENVHHNEERSVLEERVRSLSDDDDQSPNKTPMNVKEEINVGDEVMNVE